VRVLVLFAFGVALRLLFAAATPDGGAGWHVGFQGDAPIWQDFAARLAEIDRLRQQFAHDPIALERAIAAVDDVELWLPWRPPGMTWLVAALWNGEGASAWPVRTLFVALGAAVAPLVWLLLRRHVPVPVAWLTAVLCAASSNLLLLSSGLHVETAYLFVLLLALLAQQHLAGPRALPAAAAWGLLHAAACLLRAEHLVVAVALAALARATGAPWRALLVGAFAAAAPLVPWQLHVNRAVAAFNRGEPPLPATDVRWDDGAYDALRALPAFAQERVFRFVTETVRVRGRRTVREGDLDVVRDAYGALPQPVRPAFVALQGAFSFWLANTPEANGGHTRLCLDREPPLRGGDHLYPAGARTERPRGGKFEFSYVPHADVFVNGYRRGLEEIAADPVGAARRIGVKMQYAVEGATGGLGGYALPIGLSGVRPSVDLVIATGLWPGVWRALVAAAAVAGWWRLRRVRALWPLLALVPLRLALIAAFFGHARHGALVLPVVMLGVAATLHVLTAARWPRACARLAAVLMVALLALELVRANTVTAALDGRPWLAPAGGQAEYRPHTVTFH
jgi:hypothetical protein